jgi:tetratricopeptide (TPR) repeat protein
MSASVRFHEGDLAGAIDECKEAIRLRPPGEPVARALVHVSRGEWASGLEAADAALAADARDGLARWCRAEARLGLGDRPGALADWSLILASDPTSRTAWKDRGVLRALMGDRAGALEDLARAALLSPGDVVPRLWLAGLGGEGALLAPFAREEGWSGTLARLLMGRVPAAEGLAGALAAPTERERRERRCQVHGYLGLLAERDGDRVGARHHYEECASTGTWHFVTHLWSRERLASV